MVLTPGVVDAVRGDVHGEKADGALEFVGLDVVVARHRPCVDTRYLTLAITNRTTTLTISVHDTTRGTNTTSDGDSDNSDCLTHQRHHQLTRSLHQPHLH